MGILDRWLGRASTLVVGRIDTAAPFATAIEAMDSAEPARQVRAEPGPECRRPGAPSWILRYVISAASRRARGPEWERATSCLLALAIALVPIVLTPSARASSPNSPFVPCGQELSTVGLPEYSLGASAEGLERSDRERVCKEALEFEPARANYVSYLYGDCQAEDAGNGCSYPLEVQTWPACDRNLSLYFASTRTAAPYPFESFRTRGVPAARFDNGTRVELYTGAVTVVVFSDDARRASRAVASIQRVGASAVQSLPPPMSGHLTGTLSCGVHRPRLAAQTLVCRSACRRAGVRITVGLNEAARLFGPVRRWNRNRRRYEPYGTLWLSAPKADSQFTIRRLAFGRPLVPGTYRLRLVAASADGRRSLPALATFTIRSSR